MAQDLFKPFVSEDSELPELTFRAVALGTVMAIVLGAANAYLGMKAGLTVAATFPAAVVAMAALRVFGGSVLEENMARTTASVGEALVAGAIFTIPAFVISGVWDELRYWESTAIMLIGGVLGVLFIIVLRRTLVVEADLPFPESVAAAEARQGGAGGTPDRREVRVSGDGHRRRLGTDEEQQRREGGGRFGDGLRVVRTFDDRDARAADQLRRRISSCRHRPPHPPWWVSASSSVPRSPARCLPARSWGGCCSSR